MKTPITTIIVDDESNSIAKLSNDLANYPEIKVIETTTSVEKAKKIIVQHQPDLLFLDIEMPKMNGIELLHEIRTLVHSDMYVVFYSAFDKYVLEALRSSAFDYLIKPYQPEELSNIIKRIKEQPEKGRINVEQSIRRLLTNDRKFALQAISGLLLLRASEVLCFQYIDNMRSWQITMTDFSVHKLRTGIIAKDLLAFSPSFMQINQECILNTDYISSIENKTLKCILYPPFCDFNICASRRYYSKLKEQLDIL
ncbi:response regulator transcription factor [uncultured Bacteroides sp.]|uniref:LytR/AlgR family response regulator transcription factor n=1 Tax=uncultured Bacteroides sp. TaxID=162156 RepID=UPI002AAA902C|nr:response regulator transcription factor [uncultured Bacteroides sp.]